MFGAQSFDLGGLVRPFWHPGPHFGTLGHNGRPWKQQAGRAGVQDLIFRDFGVIFGLHFGSFSGSEG